MNLVNLISPNSLTGLTESLLKVDCKNCYFGENLFVLSKNIDLHPEELLAKITSVFISFVKDIPHSEETKIQLREFSQAFSTFCQKLLTQHQISNHTQTIINCSQIFVDEFVKDFDEVKNGISDNLELLLVTDIDGDRGNYDSCIERTCGYLAEEIPVIMPFQLFCNILEASFLPIPFIQEAPEENQSRNYLQKAHFAIKYISINNLEIYQSQSSQLLTILPKKFRSHLNLKNYTQISIEELKLEAILRSVGKPYDTHIEVEEIVEILSSDSQKHILWTGHGIIGGEKGFNKESLAMGLTLNKVIRILNETPNISFWDLHSCYLLGNIRSIVATVKNRNSVISINNGTISPSTPTFTEKKSIYTDCISAYFWQSSKMIKDNVTDVQSKIEGFFPLKNGFREENHPHLIFKNSKTIVPLTFPGIVETTSKVENNDLTYERLYIDKLIVESEIKLPKTVRLLSGLADQNAQHLLKEVTTPLTFEQFALSAFNDYQDGNFLYLIEKLNCADGQYDKLIHFVKKSEEHSNQATSHWWGVKDGCFFCLKRDWSQLIPEVFDADIENLLQNILLQSYPHTTTFENNLLSPESYYEAVAKAFNLNEEWKSSLLKDLEAVSTDKILEAVEQRDTNNAQYKSYFACYSEKNSAFYQALALQDKATIIELYKTQKLTDINDALLFCVGRNLFNSFSQLLNLAGNLDSKNQTEILILCCRMKRKEMLNLLDLSSENVLRIASIHGNPELFKFLLERKKEDHSINFQNLLSLSEKNHNWEMVHFLESYNS